MKMRIKIVSDGSITNSRVETEDGTLLEGITGVFISMNAKNSLVLATLYVQAPILELDIPADQIEEIR